MTCMRSSHWSVLQANCSPSRRLRVGEVLAWLRLAAVNVGQPGEAFRCTLFTLRQLQTHLIKHTAAACVCEGGCMLQWACLVRARLSAGSYHGDATSLTATVKREMNTSVRACVFFHLISIKSADDY